MKLKLNPLSPRLAAALLLAANTTCMVRAADYPTTVLGFNPLAQQKADKTRGDEMKSAASGAAKLALYSRERRGRQLDSPAPVGQAPERVATPTLNPSPQGGGRRKS